MVLQLLRDFDATQPLWRNQQFGLQQFQFPEVPWSNIKPFTLPTQLRLGHQMEHVFKHLIAYSEGYEVVLNNILVEEGKIRTGELDFILKERRTQKHIHVELAYKFYILDPTISEPIYRLMGPNRRDMFYTKLDKLKEKQFPLLYHNGLLPYWKSHGINPSEVQQHCCFKAQLFEPFDRPTSIRPLNGDCIVGKWIPFDDFNAKEFSEATYYLPRKLEWVLTPHHEVQWMSHFEALMEVNLRMVTENAPMLWVKRPTGHIEKLFVVWW